MTSLYRDEGPIPSKKARAVHRLMASDKDLDGVDFRVFLYLSSRLDFKEPTLVAQTEIADALDKKTTHVARSIRKLRDKGILIAGGKVGRSIEWRLNPDYGKEK